MCILLGGEDMLLALASAVAFRFFAMAADVATDVPICESSQVDTRQEKKPDEDRARKKRPMLAVALGCKEE
jgi:hypothetical protein